MPSYRGYRFPSEVISHAVWLYHRFSLSVRDVEDLLAERGINVTYETIRQWCLTFGLEYARRLRRRCRGDGLDLLKPFLPGFESALEDPDVSEIMINGPGNVWLATHRTCSPAWPRLPVTGDTRLDIVQRRIDTLFVLFSQRARVPRITSSKGSLLGGLPDSCVLIKDKLRQHCLEGRVRDVRCRVRDRAANLPFRVTRKRNEPRHNLVAPRVAHDGSANGVVGDRHRLEDNRPVIRV